MKFLQILVLIGVMLAPAAAAAQSLVDVARAEAERRKAVPKATKVYTNQDLQPDLRSRQPEVPSAVPPTAPPAPGQQPTPAAGQEAAPAPRAAAGEQTPEAGADSRKDEKYWRARITVAQEQLRRNQMFVEALQSRINALTTDFVNRDDPVQRASIERDRTTALAELTRVKNEIRDNTKAISDIEEEARHAGVPPGWLR
jgi:hypothetical protein